MREFRVTADTIARRNRRADMRFVLWFTVAAILAVTFAYGTGLARRVLDSRPEVLAGIVVACVYLGSYVWGLHNARDVIARQTAYVLTDTHLIRKRTGHPDIQIGLTEMKLYLRPGWLLVESSDPLRKIAIPEDVSRFEFLRTELARHVSPVRLPGRSPAINSLIGSILGGALVLASVTSWGLLFWSRSALAAGVGAAIGTMFLGWHSFLLSRHFRNHPKRPFVLAWISFQWLGAALVVCLRLRR